VIRSIATLLAATAISFTLTPTVSYADDPKPSSPASTDRTNDPGEGIDIPDEGETAISFTFDGGYKGQEEAADILFDNGMAGTFYVNSGYLNYPAYMTTDDLRAIARQRSEIGGGSLYNNNLTDIDYVDAEQQVCDDRATLAQLGFQVTSFSYPYGDDSPQAKSAAEACGYNNGRTVSGLYYSESDCSSCPIAEPLPPVDDFRIRTPSYTNDIQELHDRVELAMQSGGGWLPLIFSHICVCPELGDDAITPAAFESFVEWIASENDKIKVYTVDQVMQGPLKDVKGVPLQRLMPGGVTVTPPDDKVTHLSSTPAWTIVGFKIDQAQIMVIGILMALAVVITYRLATKKVRYVTRRR
jgi:peptidoglycan/xylan/chitin deacetylase (PgdA/CDA1 family)